MTVASKRVFVVFALVIFALYGQTIFFDLTFLDDNVWILDYQWFIQGLKNIGPIFIQPDLISELFYRPMLSASFILNAQVSGEIPWSYHFTNVIIHFVNVCLLFLLLRKFGYKEGISFVFATLFAVHPVLTQAVAWIPGRTDSLLATFVFASFICFLKFLNDRNKFAYLGHFFFLVLALLTKETAVMIPVMCFLYIYVVQKKEERLSNPREMILPWIFVGVSWFLYRSIILIKSTGPSTERIIQSLIDNSPAFLVYLGKSIIPVKLSVLPILRDSPLGYGIVAFLVIAILVLMSKTKRMRYVLFGVLWFFLFLLPSLVISFLKHEYRLYIPIVGLMFVMMELDFIKLLSARKRVGAIVAIFMVLLLSTITFFYSKEFKDRWAYWQNAVKTSPHSPLAKRNLGAMYYLKGDLDRSEELFRSSITLNSNERMVYNNLGLIAVDRGHFQQGEIEYKKEIAINPTYDNVYYNLGILYAKQQRLKEAEWAWKKAIELNPRNVGAIKNLISLYMAIDDSDSANYLLNMLMQMGVDVREEFGVN